MLLQMEEIKENVHNWEDETNEVMNYLKKILRKEAGDGKGFDMVSVMPFYTISDPPRLF